MSQELIIVIALALIFDFLNGMRDASNIVATMISSRAFSPGTALGIAAVAEFLGPFLFGVAVARTIGEDIAQLEVFTLGVIAAALIGAIVWNLITWYFGLPGSSSHALIGGMVGAVLVRCWSRCHQVRWLEQDLARAGPLAADRFCDWFSVDTPDLLSGARGIPAHQWFFQKEPTGDCPGDGIQPRHQRRAEDDGYHYFESCDRWSSAILPSADLGDRSQRGGDCDWDESGRLALDPHIGWKIL